MGCSRQRPAGDPQRDPLICPAQRLPILFCFAALEGLCNNVYCSPPPHPNDHSAANGLPSLLPARNKCQGDRVSCPFSCPVLSLSIRQRRSIKRVPLCQPSFSLFSRISPAEACQNCQTPHPNSLNLRLHPLLFSLLAGHWHVLCNHTLVSVSGFHRQLPDMQPPPSQTTLCLFVMTNKVDGSLFNPFNFHEHVTPEMSKMSFLQRLEPVSPGRSSNCVSARHARVNT